jgi:tetratricopeptide (TPR) repeat protein
LSSLQKSNVSKAFQYADEAVLLANKINVPFYIAESYFVKASVFISNGNIPDGSLWLNKALPIYQKLIKNNEIGDVYERFGAMKLSNREFAEAKTHYEKAIQFYKKSKNVKSEYTTKSMIATIYGLMGQQEKSIELQDENIRYFVTTQVGI